MEGMPHLPSKCLVCLQPSPLIAPRRSLPIALLLLPASADSVPVCLLCCSIPCRSVVALHKSLQLHQAFSLPALQRVDVCIYLVGNLFWCCSTLQAIDEILPLSA